MAFEYKQADAIDIKIIAKLVSKIFYPFEDPPVIRENFYKDIINAFKPHADEQERITEDKFCEIMTKIDKFIRKDNYERFVYKIFKRHDSNKDEFLNQEGNFFLIRIFHSYEKFSRSKYD